jgi:hypothetical protein
MTVVLDEASPETALVSESPTLVAPVGADSGDVCPLPRRDDSCAWT